MPIHDLLDTKSIKFFTENKYYFLTILSSNPRKNPIELEKNNNKTRLK